VARTKLADETEFIPADLGQARWLLDALVGNGTPPRKARGLVGWLIELPEDSRSNKVRAAYRAELARLVAPPWNDPDELQNRGCRSYPEIAALRRGGRRTEAPAALAA
jgi:hypothetical protein